LKECRESEGNPKWLIPGRDTDFEYTAGGRAGDMYVWEPSELYPDHKPERVGNEMLNGEVYKEIESDEEYINDAGHRNDVEGGQPPPGITAALALQYLGEQSSEHRRPRIN